MRARTVKKLERELRGKLVEAASRLLSTAEEQAAAGRPHLLRTVVAICHSTAHTEATKKRLELTANALEMRAELEQIKLDGGVAGVVGREEKQQIDWAIPKPAEETKNAGLQKTVGDQEEIE
ncbi:MAG TPA: hypothetical protein VKP58_11895 [Candidatus Acidoferrum sp.]|nr:hypothetical protein [Candidatus Acidoferrum sp.]